MGTHLRDLSESCLMNTNMRGFRWFSKTFRHCALDDSSLCIERVNNYILRFEGDPFFMKILTKQSYSCPYFVK